MTGYCQVCNRVGELQDNCVIEVCRQCWYVYSRARRLVVATVTCDGCAAWQRSVFGGETPQCRDCDNQRQPAAAG
jgi:hypothetical protein